MRDATIIDREYMLEASMLGYFAPDGTRNPTLKANEGDRVHITITNGETMTHDIAMEKLGLKSGTLLEEGSTTDITFWAESDDTSKPFFLFQMEEYLFKNERSSFNWQWFYSWEAKSASIVVDFGILHIFFLLP